MKYYVVCNWKMSPDSFNKAKGLIADYNKVANKKRKERMNNAAELVVCPPFLYFQLVDEKRSPRVRLGIQNIFWKSKGPYTGQIPAKMARDAGAEYVIIGHSELRWLGDTDEIIVKKIREALKNNLIPIVCVGYHDYVRETKFILYNFSAGEIDRIIFAYEPVEAVGTLKPANVKKVEQAVRTIRKLIFRRFRRKNVLGIVGLGGKKTLIPQTPILYGGSIDAENYQQYLDIPEIGGFVIGRESSNPKTLEKIVGSISSVK